MKRPEFETGRKWVLDLIINPIYIPFSDEDWNVHYFVRSKYPYISSENICQPNGKIYRKDIEFESEHIGIIEPETQSVVKKRVKEKIKSNN